jgi:hypothetical protein
LRFIVAISTKYCIRGGVGNTTVNYIKSKYCGFAARKERSIMQWKKTPPTGPSDRGITAHAPTLFVLTNTKKMF